MPSIAIPNLDREVFETVVKSIYTDPHRASLREIIANAIDANRERFGDQAWNSQVTVSFDIDNITVEDQGFGISPKVMKNIYGAMFQTTKRSGFSDTVTDANGEHGIGSKTPFGLLYEAERSVDSDANFYTVNTVFEGVRYVYKMFLSTEGIPSYELIHEEVTNRPCGTQVSFPNFLKLANMYVYCVDFSLQAGQERLLREVLIPFIDGNHTEVPVVFNGNNVAAMRVVNQILEATRGVTVAGPIRYYGMTGTRDILVKYKNILYPVADLTFTRALKDIHDMLSQSGDLTTAYRGDIIDLILSIANNGLTVFEIDLDKLDAPLKVNRSRDRFEFDTHTSEALDYMAKEVLFQMYNAVDAGSSMIGQIIDGSKIKDIINKNLMIEKLKSCHNIASGLDFQKSESIISDLKGAFDSDVQGYQCVVIDGVDYTNMVDIMFTHGDVPTSLKNYMTRHVHVDECELFDILNTITTDTRKKVNSCFMETSRSGSKFRSIRLSDGMKVTFKLLADPKNVFLIRDTKSFTIMAEGLLKSTENDFERVFVLSAKDINKDAFEKAGYQRVYYTSELVEENSDVIEEVQKVKKERASRIKGIRHIQSVHPTFDSDVIKRNQKTIDPNRLDELLAKYEGNVFYSFDVPKEELVASKDNEYFFIEKMDEKLSDKYRISRGGDPLFIGDVHASLPVSSLVFYLDKTAKQDFSKITDVGTDLDDHLKEWFTTRTVRVSGGVNKQEDLRLALRAVRRERDDEVFDVVNKFITGACNHGYFDTVDQRAGEPATGVGEPTSKRQRFFEKLFINKTHDPKAQVFVEELRQGLEANPTISYIVEKFPSFCADDEKYQAYVDFILSQLGVKKY